MSATSSEREIYGAKWAARICLALIAGLAIMTAIACYDQSRVSKLETTEENSAVGDKALFPLPAADALGKTVKFKGRELSVSSPKTYEARDSRMTREGLDDTGSYSVYVSSEPIKVFKDEVVKTGTAIYFLKTGPGRYLKLHD